MIWSAFLLNDLFGLGGRLFRTEKIVMSERPRLALVGGEWRAGGRIFSGTLWLDFAQLELTRRLDFLSDDFILGINSSGYPWSRVEKGSSGIQSPFSPPSPPPALVSFSYSRRFWLAFLKKNIYIYKYMCLSRISLELIWRCSERFWERERERKGERRTTGLST